MAVYLYTPYPMQLPIVDHVHERTHQHKTLIQSLFHQNPPPEDHPNQPDVDIRDNLTGYLIDIEIPGIKNADEIKLEAVTNHMLIITGDLSRPEAPPAPDSENNTEAAPEEHKAEEVSPHKPILLVRERRIGPFRRVFNFPSEVDMNKITANLEAGLLSLKVPIKHSVGRKPQRLDVKRAE